MSERVASVVDALGARLGARCAGGEFGAFRITTSARAPAVLKLLPPWPELALDNVRTAAGLVDHLRADGYPAPRFLAVGAYDGTVYTVQEYVDGEVPHVLPSSAGSTLLQLWQRHLDALPAGAGAGYGNEVITRIGCGAELRARTEDPRILAVLDRARAIAANAEATVFRSGPPSRPLRHVTWQLVAEAGSRKAPVTSTALPAMAGSLQALGAICVPGVPQPTGRPLTAGWSRPPAG